MCARKVCSVHQLQGGEWQMILMGVNWGRNWQMHDGMGTRIPPPPPPISRHSIAPNPSALQRAEKVCVRKKAER